MQETLPSVQELKQEFIYGKLSEESPLVTAKAPLELNLPIQKAVQKEDLMCELSSCLVDEVRRRSSFFFSEFLIQKFCPGVFQIAHMA